MSCLKVFVGICSVVFCYTPNMAKFFPRLSEKPSNLPNFFQAGLGSRLSFQLFKPFATLWSCHDAQPHGTPGTSCLTYTSTVEGNQAPFRGRLLWMEPRKARAWASIGLMQWSKIWHPLQKKSTTVFFEYLPNAIHQCNPMHHVISRLSFRNALVLGSGVAAGGYVACDSYKQTLGSPVDRDGQIPKDPELRIIGLEELRSHNNLEDGLWVSYHGHVTWKLSQAPTIYYM